MMNALQFYNNIYHYSFVRRLEGQKAGLIYLTRHDVPKPDGRHGDEAEVEGVKEAPVLPYSEDAASDAEEEGQVGQRQDGRQSVASKTGVVIVVVFFGGALCRILAKCDITLLLDSKLQT